MRACVWVGGGGGGSTLPAAAQRRRWLASFVLVTRRVIRFATAVARDFLRRPTIDYRWQGFQ